MVRTLSGLRLSGLRRRSGRFCSRFKLRRAVSRASSRRRWSSSRKGSRRSIGASPGTISGSSKAIAVLEKGRGTRNRSQLESSQGLCEATAKGTMGRPDLPAMNSVPGLTWRRGPRGPSTVTPRSYPAAPAAAMRNRARVPPRVEDPRMVPYPMHSIARVISSPSRCWLTSTCISCCRKA